MRQNLPTGGYSLPNLEEFTIKHVNHVRQRMELNAWIYLMYADQMPGFEVFGATRTIHIDAKKPENVDVYYGLDTYPWNIIWMQ
jgi:hypothetical protein